jgi:tRNA (guanine9-N1)-methyltransferase
MASSTDSTDVTEPCLRVNATISRVGGHLRLALSISRRRRVPRRQRKAALAAAVAEAVGSPTLCFDCGSFSKEMTNAEISALARQLVQCYGYNRSLPRPFRFALAGLEAAGSILAALDVHSASNWTMERKQLAPWECFSSDRQLIYLSSDAEEDLAAEATRDSSVVLVIGGLVDHASGHAGGLRVGAALRVAQAQGIRTCKLPIEGFVTVRKPSLTCTAVVQILAGVASTGDWAAAVRTAPAMRCAPLAKYVRWK